MEDCDGGRGWAREKGYKRGTKYGDTSADVRNFSFCRMCDQKLDIVDFI